MGVRDRVTGTTCCCVLVVDWSRALGLGAEGQHMQFPWKTDSEKS